MGVVSDEAGREKETKMSSKTLEIKPKKSEEVACRCGELTGERCAWRGPQSETVIVEYMPEHIRASHAHAANSGFYPMNGAVRVRVEKSCAALITENEPEWASVVG